MLLSVTSCWRLQLHRRSTILSFSDSSNNNGYTDLYIPTNQELDINSGSTPGHQKNGSSSSGPSHVPNHPAEPYDTYLKPQNGSTEPPSTSMTNNKKTSQFDLPTLHLPFVPPDPNFSLGPFNDDEFSNNTIEEDDDGLQVSPYALSYGVQGRYTLQCCFVRVLQELITTVSTLYNMMPP